MANKAAMMSFAEALNSIKNGLSVYRVKWFEAEKQVYLELQVTTDLSKMTEPYIYKVELAARGKQVLVPWTPAQEDLLANDWQVYTLFEEK